MSRFVLATLVSSGACAVATAASQGALGPPTLLTFTTALGWLVLMPRDRLRVTFGRVSIVGILILALLAHAAIPGLSPAMAIGAGWGVVGPILLQRTADTIARVQTFLLSLAGAHIGLWLALTALSPESVSGMAGIAILTASGTLAGSLPLHWQPIRQRPTFRRVQNTLAQPYRPDVLRALRLTARGLPLAPDTTTAAGLDEVCAWVYRLQMSAQQLTNDLVLIDEAGAQRALETTPLNTPSAHQHSTNAHYRQVLHHCEVLRSEIRRTHATVSFALAWLADAVSGLSVARARPDDAVAPDIALVLRRLRAHGDVQEACRRTQREIATPVVA